MPDPIPERERQIREGKFITAADIDYLLDQLAAVRQERNEAQSLAESYEEAHLPHHEVVAEIERLRAENEALGAERHAAELCARLLENHLTGDGGYGGKPTKLDCWACEQALDAWRSSRPTPEGA